MPPGSWRRPAYWVAVLLAVLAIASGVTLAKTASPTRLGPAAVVRGYFAALQRGDASAALGYGGIPAGSRRLLTPAVLAEQQRVAPLGGVTVLAVRRTGSHAAVRVRYQLSFAEGQHVVAARLRLHRAGGWRLRAVAVRTRLRVVPAGQRATLAGAAIPHRPVLLFPGAAPVRFDTPFLVDGPSAGVRFGAGATVVRPVLSRAGQLAAIGAASAALRRCLHPASGASSAACPLPSGRVMPGSVRGRPVTALGDHLHARLVAGPAGVLQVSGHAEVAARYQRLTFRNQVQAAHGRVRLPVRARGLAVPPLQLRWAP